MTRNKTFKRDVRALMALTGQRYTDASVDLMDAIRTKADAPCSWPDPTHLAKSPQLRIAFVGWVGGRGTSTHALYVAQALAELGLKVTLLDCNPWLDLVRLQRVAPDLPVSIKAAPVPDIVWAADSLTSGADVVVLDSPPLNGERAHIGYGCVEYADEIVTPIPGNQHECHLSLPINVQLQRVRPDVRRCALLWGGRTNSRSTAVARGLLADQGFDTLDPVVYDRTAYSSLSALLAHVKDDTFPAVAEALLDRHNKAVSGSLGQTDAARALRQERATRRKLGPLTERERRILRDRLRATWRVSTA